MSILKPWHARLENLVALVDWLLSDEAEYAQEDRECAGRDELFIPRTPEQVHRIYEKPWRFGSEWLAYVEYRACCAEEATR